VNSRQKKWIFEQQSIANNKKKQEHLANKNRRFFNAIPASSPTITEEFTLTEDQTNESDAEIILKFSSTKATEHLLLQMSMTLEEMTENTTPSANCPLSLLTPPTMPLLTLFNRFVKYAEFKEHNFIVMMLIIEIYLETNKQTVLHKLNLFPVVIASLTIGSKITDDTYWENKYISKVSGMPLKDLNYIELTFFLIIHKYFAFTDNNYNFYKNAYNPPTTATFFSVPPKTITAHLPQEIVQQKKI
jgi:hypothetical protein